MVDGRQWREQIFRKHMVLPAEHGSWIWWIGPLVLGASAAGRVTSDLAWLSLAALAAFLFRQPLTIVIKILSARRSRRELLPALIWTCILGGIAAGALTGLIAAGNSRLLWLAIPGLLVFAWHLRLVSRRQERGQLGIELVAAGVLALTAPAAYWTAGGMDLGLPWLLWSFCWLQSAASIVFIYFRLDQRELPVLPPAAERGRTGQRTLTYHAFNLAAALLASLLGWLPWLMTAAFGLMLADALEGVLRPPVRRKPAAIGLRQLMASLLFFLISTGGLAMKHL
jgi:hypothetical protein